MSGYGLLSVSFWMERTLESFALQCNRRIWSLPARILQRRMKNAPGPNAGGCSTDELSWDEAESALPNRSVPSAGRRGNTQLRLRFPRLDPAIELMDNARHVEFGLAIGRNPMIFVHRRGTTIIGRQRRRQIVVIASQQSIEIRRPAAHILFRPEAVLHTQVTRGGRHHLPHTRGPG